jgi:N-methylhydantoinase A
MTVSIGSDIGGTFTDIVVVDESGSIITRKVLSTPEDYAQGVSEGTGRLLGESQIDGKDVRDLRHGSTVATNAILERAGAHTALLTTAGFRDVLEIGRIRLPDLYNLAYAKPPPLVERALRREVSERINARGEVVVPLREANARRLIKELARTGVEAIAISLVNSWINPVHERQLAGLVRECAPTVFCSVSSDLLPRIGEYERTSTTVINAFVQPTVARYLRSLEDGMRSMGLNTTLWVMQSNGGLMAASRAADRPAHLIESGPVAGVIAARVIAKRCGFDRCITFDMGGTTAKASLIERGEVRISSDYEVGGQLSRWGGLLEGYGYALALPAAEIAEVGAGGGSIASIDAGGGLRVGPESSGARPGPACYGRGGELATVTDANVVLGYINPTSLAGGAIDVDFTRAAAAIERHAARPLGLGRERAAFAIHAVANATMIGAIKAVTTQRGRDPRECVLLAFGGGGPVHAAGLAEQLGIRKVVVPTFPGLFSAFGLLMADHAHHHVRSFHASLSDMDAEDLYRALKDVDEESIAELSDGGLDRDHISLRRSVDVRFVGQGHELTVPLRHRILNRRAVQELQKDFVAEHRRTYGHHFGDEATEIVSLHVVASIRKPPVILHGIPSPRTVVTERPDVRLAYFDRLGPVETKVWRRHAPAGVVRGPAIIEEDSATTVVPPGWRASTDASGNIVIEAQEW